MEPINVLVLGDGDRLPIPEWCRKAAYRLSAVYVPTAVVRPDGEIPRLDGIMPKITITHKKTYNITDEDVAKYAMIIYIPCPSADNANTGWAHRHGNIVAMCAIHDSMFFIDSYERIHIDRYIARLISNNAYTLAIKEKK